MAATALDPTALTGTDAPEVPIYEDLSNVYPVQGAVPSPLAIISLDWIFSLEACRVCPVTLARREVPFATDGGRRNIRGHVDLFTTV
jgi:hypothetical protein